MSSSFRDLVAWQRAMELAEHMYQATKLFPKEETFGLKSQLPRAAISVASNIAEGQGRLTRGEYKQFLGQARGSLLEVMTQVELAARLRMLTTTQRHALDAAAENVLKPLNGLIRCLSSAKP